MRARAMPSETDAAFRAWMADIQARTERALDRALPPASIAPQRLHAAMRYAVLGGGKRIRPLLVHAAGALACAAPGRLERAACAVELIHAYSLVHDDLPCMDDDRLRRGRPTCHVEFGEATALLVGDALQSAAFRTLVEGPEDIAPALRVDLVRLLAQAAGSRGMAGGQAIDLDAVGGTLSVEELEFMHIHKTGALIRASVAMGARLGGGLEAGAAQALDRYARCAGLLFQVVDDILDCEASTATLGKTAGKDRAHEKPTYVTVLGRARAHAFAHELLDEALGSIAALGPAAGRLRELARFIVERKF
ncbi:MAG: polyprenyl synthetase family protein [Rhodocyclaceae bacterium]